MTKSYSTKRSLITSVIALMLCFSMLLGTTFAWFTDSVTSANNIIKSGNLDIQLSYKNDEVTNWAEVKDDTNVFKKETLWEPGHVEVVKLKITNAGTLALKYQLGVNVASETGSTNVEGNPFKLSDYIKYGIYAGDLTADREAAIAAVEADATALNVAYLPDFIGLEKGQNNIVTLVVYMPETIGNEANYKFGEVVPTINLGINLIATQLTSEEDSFDDQYDKDAVVADAYVATMEDLLAALEDDTIDSIGLTSDVTIPSSSAGSNGYGKTGIAIDGLTFDGGNNNFGVDAWATWDSAINITGGTIKNITINKGMRGIFINHNGTGAPVILENVTVDGTIYTISCDQGTNNGLKAYNSTFKGWTSYAATIGDVEFTNCTFGAGQGYNFSRPYAPTTYVGCNFESGHRVDARAAVTFENCTLDGAPLTDANLATLVTSNIANATVK